MHVLSLRRYFLYLKIIISHGVESYISPGCGVRESFMLFFLKLPLVREKFLIDLQGPMVNKTCIIPMSYEILEIRQVYICEV